MPSIPIRILYGLMLWTTTSPVTSSLLMPWRRPCAYRETVKRMQAIMKATRLDVIALFLVDGWQYEWRCAHRQPPSRTGVSVITFEDRLANRRGGRRPRRADSPEADWEKIAKELFL